MEKIDPSTLSLVVSIESKDYAPEDSEWQEECHKFYMQIKNALDEGTVESLKVEKEEEGHRGGFLEIFSTIKEERYYAISKTGGFTPNSSGYGQTANRFSSKRGHRTPCDQHFTNL